MAKDPPIGVPNRKPDPDYEGSYEVVPEANNPKGPILLNDGTLEVENVRERSSDGLGYSLSAQKDKYIFTQKMDGNTQIQYIPKNVDKVYETTVKFKDTVKQAFAVYRNDVKRFAIKELDRYKSCRKALKKEIDKIEKNKNQFIFTEPRAGSLWNQIYIDSTMFGPYEYDVQLEVTKDIEMINDLLVVRTGHFTTKIHKKTGNTFLGPSGLGVAWVSPHNTLVYSGKGIYVNSGNRLDRAPWSTGQYSGVGYDVRTYGITSGYPTHALSSKFIKIPKGEIISSGLTYQYYSDHGGLTSDQQFDPRFQSFYYTYQEYQNNFAISGFDGVIPSGVPFSIDTFSTNPRYIGFNGEISVKPVDSTIAENINLSYECEGISSNANYQSSVRGAVKAAKKKFYKKLNKALISLGIKRNNKQNQRYEKLLEKVAQNAYDGLSMVRNDQIAKVQGLESNPLDSPIYYDGTSKVYGGNKDQEMFNSADTQYYRSDGGGSSGTGSSTSSGGSSSTY